MSLENLGSKFLFNSQVVLARCEALCRKPLCRSDRNRRLDVQLEWHYWHDVLAGAAVGYFTTQLELRQSRGLILRPFISGGAERRSGEQKTAAFSWMKTF